MKSLRKILSSLILLVLVLILIFSHNAVGIFLISFKKIATSFFESCEKSEVFKVIEIENNRLKLELSALREEKIKSSLSQYRKARVYSRYPFNDRARLIIDLGLRDGIKEGMPIVLMPGVILGKVIEVKKNQSEVITLFDPEWRSSVAIGLLRAKALLKGGKEPKLELIPRDIQLKEGDDVLNISPELPMNFSLGSLNNLSEAPHEVWRTADLETNYNPEIIEEVLVVFDFP
ncbi:MAG: rod shape-determining protein MreC [Patescibacteria group bacterium]|nr:rod shape-determining protein MreC [Patescibacteria group bacterium]